MNKTIVISGASDGIGAFTALEAANKGYNVVITYLTHENEAIELVNYIIKKYKVDALCVKCDISNEDDINNLLNKSIERFGKVDILINNAAICIDGEFNEKKKEDYMRTLEVNLVGTFLMSRIFGNHMVINGSGVITNISSNNGIDNYNEYSLEYDSSKAGIINLTHNLASHYAPFIRVNAICPGWTETTSVKQMNPNYLSEEKKKILLERFAKPEEIAKTIMFVSSDEGSYINDSIIKVDGGLR